MVVCEVIICKPVVSDVQLTLSLGETNESFIPKSFIGGSSPFVHFSRSHFGLMRICDDLSAFTLFYVLFRRNH